MTKIINTVKFKKLEERILEYLKAKKTKEIKITHQTLAQDLAAARVSVSRVLKKLEKAGKLKLLRGVIVLL